ncbi:fluoride efflux transporter CrcB [Cohnella terricola]|uniref:Fluoride-specific ion channel FluC n=1 Tax=Cohnella terricola TaxID=1289167 RepID=A0A559JTS9_9BACL|nr:fluoride efflux transporter CrcB [Cohnella terricola]TVY03288.1 fluoride efflux transporter CrcB [Cohnella terricola]
MKTLAVGLFGICGAMLRYLIGLWAQDWWASPFPFGTLTANFLGCLFLGWFSGWAASIPNMPAWLRLGIGTGFVGAFTTFSALSMESVTLVQDGQLGVALLYVLISLFGGLALAWIGHGISRRYARRPAKGDEPR